MTGNHPDPAVQAVVEVLIEERDRRTRAWAVDPLVAIASIARDVEWLCRGMAFARRLADVQEHPAREAGDTG